ncbi:hypothetical protein H4S07_004011 [Coemansia furcata]|uniref:Uncharacterized protein n=1 Tax=Coemansia furcata TaxID=417177 RepID=A0ACC1LDL9_9FUNG|nr:hypothetical protein H4S07_004011 [Coemansia furcata]
MSDTSEQQRLPRAFIGIHDKTPEMRILYVTSSTRELIGFEASEVVGQTALWFIDNGNADEYEEHFGGDSDDSVILTQVYIRSNFERPVYTRLVSFGCDNLVFNVCFPYSDSVPRVVNGPLRVEKLSSGSGSELMHRQRSLMAAHQERHRTTVLGGGLARACLTLESIDECSERPMGPRVLFASNSFDRIINVDACDMQGVPFLFLVAPVDVAKAGRFLDNIKTASNIVIEHLQLLVDPLGESPSGTVAVEMMAAGADNGAIMLCQLARPPPGAGGQSDDGYMSLEEIISSEAETTDIAEMWR